MEQRCVFMYGDHSTIPVEWLRCSSSLQLLTVAWVTTGEVCGEDKAITPALELALAGQNAIESGCGFLLQSQAIFISWYASVGALCGCSRGMIAGVAACIEWTQQCALALCWESLPSLGKPPRSSRGSVQPLWRSNGFCSSVFPVICAPLHSCQIGWGRCLWGWHL